MLVVIACGAVVELLYDVGDADTAGAVRLVPLTERLFSKLSAAGVMFVPPYDPLAVGANVIVMLQYWPCAMNTQLPAPVLEPTAAIVKPAGRLLNVL